MIEGERGHRAVALHELEAIALGPVADHRHGPSLAVPVDHGLLWGQSKDGVEAVGQGRRNGEDCIEVKVSKPDAAGRIPGQTPGAAIAALATIGYSGFVVGPPFIGVVADATSLRFALGLMVIACAAIAVAANVVEPRARPATKAAH